MTLPSAFLHLPLAHRALHDVADARPENSRAAINAAIAAGYGLEIDVQLSADGVAMVFHDYELSRLTGANGPLRQLSAVALSAIPLTGADEGIPSLPEVLALVAGRVPLLIEIKDQDGAMGPNIGLLEDAVAEALQGYTGDVAVMSFNPNSVSHMGKVLPDVPRGLVTDPYSSSVWPLPRAVCERLRGIPDYDRVGACFISHNVTDLDRPRVAALKQAGAHIMCWTVRDQQMEAKARKIADNITFEGYLAPLGG